MGIYLRYNLFYKSIDKKQNALNMRQLIEAAIAAQRIIRFQYKGRYRIGEPHILGTKGTKEQLLIFQLAGNTNTHGLPQWRRVNVEGITDLEITKYTFDNKRQLVTGTHRGWDEFLAVAKI